MDTAIKQWDIDIENKTFSLILTDNERGRFLRITEITSNGRRNSIVVPLSGLCNLNSVLSTIITGYCPPHPTES